MIKKSRCPKCSNENIDLIINKKFFVHDLSYICKNCQSVLVFEKARLAQCLVVLFIFLGAITIALYEHHKIGQLMAIFVLLLVSLYLILGGRYFFKLKVFKQK